MTILHIAQQLPSLERRQRVRLLLLLAFLPLFVSAQSRFYNLTRDEVKIDSMLPHVAYTQALSGAWADTTYSARIAYPDYIPGHRRPKQQPIAASLARNLLWICRSERPP